ncbi:MAG TPA: heterodisulfide reductase-related iron-sulfur binding cluster [Verrucomicrobiota bacterium]|nr:heterodisulfide reductase-related iron-sulfur binding cluster [Verrucomicrobiota bacterium]HNT13361.1 heterodisulfide reductase-related iron-sulfur binding cluster [Verrucomicrobiota bacterium]
MIPTRETFGNIPPASILLFYLLTIISLAIFAHGVWRRFKLWRQGVSIDVEHLFRGGFKQVCARLKPGLLRLWTDALGQQRVRGRGLASLAHIWLFAGFMMLFLGTTMLEVDNIASWISKSLHFHQGTYYVIYEFTLDAFGLLFLAGCVMFVWRRTRRPPSLGHNAADWYVLISFLAIGITGYLVEALRIVWQQPEGIGAKCSFVGLWMAHWFSGLTEAGARSTHLVVWWVHSLLVFLFIATIPYTRLMHIILGPLNLFFAPAVLGRMKPITMEEVEQTERIGVAAIEHYDQQQLLSLDACMECGRCEEACPAFASGKPLSPKRVVQDLKGLMTANLSLVAPAAAAGAPGAKSFLRALHDETILAETLWACTACSACVQVCPVRIDQLTLITDLRRNRVGEGALSGTAATALRRMQASGNPWGLPPTERGNWAEGLRAPTVRENPNFEWLYWIGCAGAYDRRAQRVARAMVKLLNHAQVNFAILGREEKCTGDSARRLGEEFLFQELAQANIATLTKYKVRKILTHCPHGLNAFLKDYPQFGGHYEVVHHSQLLEQLIAAGRLKVPAAASGADAITYHDPCYLARVNRIHDAPRSVLSASTKDLREMGRRREKTFCCGAGGGRIWMEEDPKQRVSTLRAREALGTGAKTVAVSCPFCLTMMTDGIAAQSSTTRVLDIAEILADKLSLPD